HDDGGTSNSQGYTYWAAPSVSSVHFNAGPTSGARQITVYGGNFVAGDISVYFGQPGAPQGYSITVNSTSQLTVTTPQEGAGTVDVIVRSTGGYSAVNGGDHYQFMNQGYWIASATGQLYAYGGAVWHGNTGSLNKPISGMVATPDGQGYWLTAQDGGVFTFGDAGYYGSEGGKPLN